MMDDDVTWNVSITLNKLPNVLVCVGIILHRLTKILHANMRNIFLFQKKKLFNKFDWCVHKINIDFGQNILNIFLAHEQHGNLIRANWI